MTIMMQVEIKKGHEAQINMRYIQRACIHTIILVCGRDWRKECKTK